MAHLVCLGGAGGTCQDARHTFLFPFKDWDTWQLQAYPNGSGGLCQGTAFKFCGLFPHLTGLGRGPGCTGIWELPWDPYLVSPQDTDHSSPLWAPQKLEEQEQRARRLKEKLRSQQQSLRRQLEQLQGPTGGERLRANSLDSSGLCSERSDSDQGKCPSAGGGGGGDQGDTGQPC